MAKQKMGWVPKPERMYQWQGEDDDTGRRGLPYKIISLTEVLLRVI